MTSNIVIIGVHKAGTSSMFEILSCHDEVCQSSIKETHFFSAKESDYWKSAYTNYQDFFGCDTGVFLEASPEYFYLGHDAIEGMDEELARKAHYVLLLRRPTEKIASSYRHMRSKNVVDTWAEFRDRELNESKLDYYNLCPGAHELTQCDYSKHLLKWQRFIAERRLTIIDFDTFREDPLSACNQILAAVGCCPLSENEVPRLHTNKSSAHKNKSLHKVALWVFRFFEGWLRQRPRLKSMLANLYEKANSREFDELVDTKEFVHLDKAYEEIVSSIDEPKVQG